MQTLIRAAALMAGALISSAAHAQCFGSLNAITSLLGTVNTAFLPSGSAFLSAPSSAPDQQGGGVWTRAVAGTVDTQNNSNFNALFTVTPPAGPNFQVPLSLSCRAKIDQDFVGFEAGHDIAVLNTGNSGMSWHFGLLAGYVTGNAKDATPGNTNGPQTGTFNAPSAGLYAAFSKGSFFADVQGRLYELQGETLGQRGDARGYSFTGNAGYRFDLGGNWSLEPSVGGIYSRTSFDQLQFTDLLGSLGAPVLGFPIPTSSVLGAMQINDVESALGRASVKLGTSLPLYGGRIIAYPFVTASVFHEFDGNVTTSVAAGGSFPGPFGGQYNFRGSGILTASSIGTYGQFGAGSAFQLADTGWLGYARVDYRTGDNIDGWSVNAGLRYQLNPDTASFKEGGSIKDAPAEGYDWSGPYVGVSAGSTWGRMHWASGATVDPDYAGLLAGGQAGFNFQKGQFVWGLEADAGASTARGAKGCPIDPIVYNCNDDVGVLGSLTGRFGYAWGRALFYAKGGWAFGEVTAGMHFNPVDPGFPPSPVQLARSTNWESGWTLGGGMEFALTNRWSAKAEYMHYEFPQDTFTVAQNVTPNATTSGDTVRIGLNYHFAPR
jgi:opacity protein-like surface antigen